MLHRLLIVSLVLAGAVGAQCQPSSGIFAGVQASLSVDDTTTAGGGGNLLLKGIGFRTTPPTAWPAGAGPDFAIEKAFKNCGVVGAMPDVDALTLGMDIVLADDATGKVSVPANRWGAITFSVTRGTKGASRSVIAGESVTLDGASGDIFSWVLPGSVVPKELIGVTQRVQDSREIDLGTGTVKKNVDALEHIIPLYKLEPALVNSFLPVDPTIYFSVSTATLNRVPASWWGSAAPASGATILKMTWNHLKGVWSCPTTYMTFKQIGLAQDEDIDALALDISTSRMLFSTKTPTRNPILFRAFGALASAAIQTYTDPVTNKPVSEEIGLIGTDDVDAICALDPSLRGGSNGGNPIFFTVGTPRPRTLPGPLYINASAIRGYTAGVPEFRTYLTGWPATGQGPGFAMLFVTPPDSLDPLIFVGFKARNPASTFCGDPLEFILPIPAWASMHAIPLNLRWYAFDAALTTVAEAHPLLIRL